MSDHTAAAARSASDQAPGADRPLSVVQDPDAVAQAADLARRSAEAGLEHGRAIVRRTTRAINSPATDPRSVWSWLVRASFTLFSASIVGVIGLSAFGLLGTAETMAILGPVITLTAVIVGVALADSLGGIGRSSER